MRTLKMTVSFVNVWEVLEQMGYSNEDISAILEAGFNGVSYGDASLTLIGNSFALECIIDGIDSLNTPFDETLMRARYWEVVGADDYINMESM